MSWLSKYGLGLIGSSLGGVSPLLSAIGDLNRKDTVPQASPDPRIANSTTSSGNVVGTNTGGYGAPVKR